MYLISMSGFICHYADPPIDLVSVDDSMTVAD